MYIFEITIFVTGFNGKSIKQNNDAIRYNPLATNSQNSKSTIVSLCFCNITPSASGKKIMIIVVDQVAGQ